MKYVRSVCAVVLGIACTTMLLYWSEVRETLIEQSSDSKPSSTAPNELNTGANNQDDGSRGTRVVEGTPDTSTSALDAIPESNLTSVAGRSEASNERALVITQLELKFAEEAVGRPFPVSPVTARTCSDPRTAPYTRCEDVMSSLKKFSEEERDLTWARDSEERLEESLENEQLGEYSILALECRSTRCAIEITTLQDPHWGKTVRDGDFRRDLLPGAAVWTSASDESGQRIYTTLRIFARHSALKNGRLPE